MCSSDLTLANTDGRERLQVRESFADDYHQAARNFVAGSHGADENGDPIAVYHGTQSPHEIQQLNPSKLDPNALYGPGFYMTQDHNIAAEDGGYVSNKSSNVGKYDGMSSEDLQNTLDYKTEFQREYDSLVSKRARAIEDVKIGRAHV